MSYGLVNAPFFFQTFRNDVFRDNKFVVVNLDDIFNYSTTMSEHVSHVRQVPRCLLSHGLYGKAEKELSFLGYRIGPRGVGMDVTKVTAMSEWPEPQLSKELQRFLGFADFYCRFTWGFSSIVASLTDLKGK